MIRPIRLPPKTPIGEVSYGLDWSGWLRDPVTGELTDTLASASWDLPDDLVELESYISGRVAVIKIGGGTPDTDYDLLCRIVSAAGEKEGRRLQLLVRPL